MFYREAQQNIQSFLMALRRKPHRPERIHHDSGGSLGRSRSRSLPALGCLRELPLPALPSLAPEFPNPARRHNCRSCGGHWEPGARALLGFAISCRKSCCHHFISLLFICFEWQEKLLQQNPSEDPPGTWKGGTVSHQGTGSSAQTPVPEIPFSSGIFPVSPLQ